MATRRELKDAIRQRYQGTTEPRERRGILSEFVRVTGYHRKHALRVLNHPTTSPVPHQPERVYDEAVHQALTVLWEAADRICGKRLRVLIPALIEAMERHGYLQLDPAVRSRLLDISAATIDRLLHPDREATGRMRRRRWGAGSAVRQSVPVRTFADWGNPPPGYFECDLVEHCGGIKDGGNFVHTLTLTDIHSGWTECAALAVREQSLVVEGISAVTSRLPFALRGLDTDNDSAFHERDTPALLQSARHRMDSFARLPQERSGLGRAEERRCGAASGRIRAAERARCGRRTPAPV